LLLSAVSVPRCQGTAFKKLLTAEHAEKPQSAQRKRVFYANEFGMTLGKIFQPVSFLAAYSWRT